MSRLIAALGVTALIGISGAAQTMGSPERFTAFAVNMGSLSGRTSSSPVDIVINRWSTEAERGRLMSTLMDKGPEKLLDALQKNPKVGYIKTPNSLGYDLHYAHKTPLPEGAERVVIATDRYITFWEARNQPRSIDYPFTVIEMHINRDGTGEGKMSIATKIQADKESQTIELENYGTQPVMLQNVHREVKSK
jgi:hypothetical protein